MADENQEKSNEASRTRVSSDLVRVATVSGSQWRKNQLTPTNIVCVLFYVL